MMISDKQLEANRSSALLSTGPTEEGKKRFSLTLYVTVSPARSRP
jgi:hypothetical protein